MQPPKGSQHASRPRQAQSSTLATWPLWSKLQGSGFDRRSRESYGAYPEATTGVILAHDVGCTRVAPSTSDTPRYLPREAQHASARPRQA